MAALVTPPSSPKKILVHGRSASFLLLSSYSRPGPVQVSEWHFHFPHRLVGNGQSFCRVSGKAQSEFSGKVGAWCLKALSNMLLAVLPAKSSF